MLSLKKVLRTNTEENIFEKIISKFFAAYEPNVFKTKMYQTQLASHIKRFSKLPYYYYYYCYYYYYYPIIITPWITRKFNLQFVSRNQQDLLLILMCPLEGFSLTVDQSFFYPGIFLKFILIFDIKKKCPDLWNEKWLCSWTKGSIATKKNTTNNIWCKPRSKMVLVPWNTLDTLWKI